MCIFTTTFVSACNHISENRFFLKSAASTPSKFQIRTENAPAGLPTSAFILLGALLPNSVQDLLDTPVITFTQMRRSAAELCGVALNYFLFFCSTIALTLRHCGRPLSCSGHSVFLGAGLIQPVQSLIGWRSSALAFIASC